MSSEAETVQFTVAIADTNGVAIREGSVLESLEDGERGVVVRILRAGDMGSLLDQIGDLNIKTGPGSTRVSNQYRKWRHIPHDQQTYQERYESWLHRKYEHGSDLKQVSHDMGLCIDGIMALLPSDTVNWEYGPWPDSIEETLRFLVKHLEKKV